MPAAAETFGLDRSCAACRRARTEESAAVAVLGQNLVAARAAGVAFSSNPVAGADEVVGEAVRGLVERLASGEVAADRWGESPGGTKSLVDTDVLATAAVKE